MDYWKQIIGFLVIAMVSFFCSVFAIASAARSAAWSAASKKYADHLIKLLKESPAI